MVTWPRALFRSSRFRPALLLLAITAWRLWAAAAIPLTEDEAYYRLWAQHLAWGYFDHPPMIAWWIAVGIKILGDNALGVRLLAVLSCSATSLLLAPIVRRLGGSEHTAGRAIIWYQAALLVGLGGLLATPDAPTTLLWTAVVWLALEAEARRPRLWIAVGLAAGLALLSKYSALFLPVGLGLWLIARPEGRRELRTPWPWLAGVLALALFGLNIAWNATHGWLSFSKQFGRAAVQGFSPKHLIELIVIQAFLLNPLIAIFAAKGLARLWRTRQTPLPGLLAPTLIAAPFAAYLAFHSLHAQVQAHWPVPLYPLAVLLAVFGAEVSTSRLSRRLARLAPWSLAFCVIASAHLALPRSDLTGVTNWVLPIRGWPDFARRVEAARQREGATWVGTFSYGSVAQLRLTGDIAAPVIQLTERRRYPADDVPAAFVNKRPGLVVDLQRRLDLGDLGRCFKTVTVLEGLDRGDKNGPSARYLMVRVQGARRDVIAQGCWSGKTPDGR